MLLGVCGITGCATGDSSAGGSNVTATPTFSPGAGTYNTSQTVTIADTTAGAVLYCTTDGTAPTTSSPQCAQPTTVFKTQFLQAIAVAPGKTASAVASAGYTINLNAAATPSFSPDGGSYTGAQQVTINDATTGANVYYTLDGSTPGPNSTLYTGPVNITKSATLSAVAIASGLANSGIRSASYTISTGPAAPVISPAGGTFTSAQTVTITEATPGAAIYYTTDGSTPTSRSTLYSGSFTVSTNQTVSAIAVAAGANSAVTTAAFVINLPAAATPNFSPAAGTYTSTQTVVLSDATPGATIYYTTDGSAPTTTSSVYDQGAGITVSASQTVRAIAVAPGFGQSTVASAAYVINISVAAPVISPAGGTFTSAQTVTITDSTPSAAIYYTTDGSTPSSHSTLYSGTFTVSANQTVRAIAAAAGANSAVTTATFVINLPAAAVPNINPAAGTYNSTQTVVLSDTTPGATIYYTTDGSAPTTSSSVYNQGGSGITVSASQTVKAIAVAPGFGQSAVVSAVYVINGTVAAPTISPTGGTYSAAQTVTITDATAGATIYYTTDGNTPTTSSPVYSAPITAGAGTQTITAIAVANGVTSAPTTATYTINLGPSYVGKVMSGTTPVSGATVQMYAAGNSGYSSDATLVTTASAITGADGSFTLYYNCPSAPADLVYVVATGGNAGSGGSNGGLALMAALGSCNGSLPTPLVVNEATTVASTYALSQFMSSATKVGSASSTASVLGLTNAFKAVNNLVDLTTGTVRDHTPDYPTNLAGDPNILNNSNVPQTRINTLANILNACAASNAACSGLFSATTPGAGGAPADTLQASLNIAKNPGNNASMVYNVAPGTGPFAPTLPAAPNDWTLAITFTGGGLGYAPSLTPRASSGSSGHLKHEALAIDAEGSIWTAAYNCDSTGTACDLSSGMVAKFSNLGAPLTPASTYNSTAVNNAVYGGFIPFIGITGGSNAGTLATQSIAIDPSGNAWFMGGDGSAVNAATNTNGLTEIAPNLSVVNPFVPLPLATAGRARSPLLIDGTGSLWFQTTLLGMEKYDSAGTMLLGDSTKGNNPPGTSRVYQGLQQLTFDSTASALWGSMTTFGFRHIDPATDKAVQGYFQTTSTTGAFSPVLASATKQDGSAGDIYACVSDAGQSLNAFNPTSTTGPVNTFPVPTTRGCGNQAVIDGDGHIFAVTGGNFPGILDEFSVGSSGLTMISPTSTGYTGTSGSESPTLNPDPNAPAIFTLSGVSSKGVTGAAIDGSGNLWVLNTNTGTTASPGNVLVEFIGIAAPVVTPTSVALQFGQVGGRP
jgi:hypothetical protein